MILALLPAAFADGATPTGTLTIKGQNGGKLDGSRYFKILQVFLCDVTTDGNTQTLTNITFGDCWGSNERGYWDGSDYVEFTPSGAVPEGLLNYLKTSSLGIAATLENLVGSGANPVTPSFDESNGWYVASGLPSGYYLVREETEELPGSEVRSVPMSIVVGESGATLNLKNGTITSQKKVKDTNDSTGATSDWQDSADYDVGDTVPFQLKATLPENFDLMTGFLTVRFHDQQEEGLRFNPESVKVYYQLKGKEPKLIDPSDYTLATEAEAKVDEDCTFEIVFWNIRMVDSPDANKDLPGPIDKDTVIIVEYTSTLTDDAVGAGGVKNTSWVSFNSDKFSGKTPKDTVVVFTYQVEVKKVRPGSASGVDMQVELAGAGFTLYKQVPSTTEGAQSGEAIKKTFASNIKAGALENGESYITVGSYKADAYKSTFNFKGIDDGIYVLVETTVPAGYNAWDAVEFTVDATHSDGDAPALTELTGGDLFSGSVSLGNGMLSTKIENRAGSPLPATGGMGTTCFYIVGTVLALGAAIALIAKKRASC